MIPDSKAFNGKTSYEHDGKIYQRWYYVSIRGDYLLHFHFLSSNSQNAQGIALFFSDFDGSVVFCGNSLPVPKAKFKHYLFKQEDMPSGTFSLDVHNNSGSLFFGNASKINDRIGYDCGAFGCAFWIEKFEDNHLRFHCNDHEYDDDFDDLVFDLFIEPKNFN